MGPPLCCTTLQATHNCLADHRCTRLAQDMVDWIQMFWKHLLHCKCLKHGDNVEESWDDDQISQSSSLSRGTRHVRMSEQWPFNISASNVATNGKTLGSVVPEMGFLALMNWWSLLSKMELTEQVKRQHAYTCRDWTPKLQVKLNFHLLSALTHWSVQLG